MIRLQLARMLSVSASTGSAACCVTSQTWREPGARSVPGSSDSWLGNAFSQIEKIEHDDDREELLGHRRRTSVLRP